MWSIVAAMYREILEEDVEADYPFGCAPGVYGVEGDVAGQSGPSCSGACPAGSSCGPWGRQWGEGHGRLVGIQQNPCGAYIDVNANPTGFLQTEVSLSYRIVIKWGPAGYSCGPWGRQWGGMGVSWGPAESMLVLMLM